MPIDENIFFRQMTLRICGSLDINTVLERCYLYLKDFIPLSSIHFLLFDTDSFEATIPAMFSPDHNLALAKEIFPPKRFRQEAIALWKSMNPVGIINRPADSQYYLEFFQTAGVGPNISTLMLRLEMEENRIGALVLIAEGTNRYTTEHAKLVLLLHEPFAIALFNSLKHKDVRHLKTILEDDNRYLYDQLWELSGTEIIGKDLGLKTVFEKVRRVAPTDSPVLLQGETGTGKEVIAHAIHSASLRKDGPFIKVNCGAIPEHLIDSELFGHEKGSFTGAVATKRGRFERAHKGTIFLDEIGELPPQAQVRLLHVLQNQVFERVGGTKPIKIDTRVISATHRDLQKMIVSKQFREDLWFRLNVFPIQIPPLRDRMKDIPALLSYFIEKKKRELKMDMDVTLCPGSMENLMAYHWPGNVRELMNVIEHALIQHDNGCIFIKPQDSSNSYDVPAETAGNGLKITEGNAWNLDEAMRIHIEKALKRCNGKISGPGGIAELLGVVPNTLRKRMDKLGISYRKTYR